MKLARNERGFTLIELMVVLIIMGILAAIAIPTMSKQSDKAKNKRAVSELKSMKTCMDIYINDPNVNPGGTAPVGIIDAGHATQGAANADAAHTVLAAGGVTQFADPWGTPYNYAPALVADTIANYTLYSFGANKAVAGGDDIYVRADQNPTEGVSVNAVGAGPTDYTVNGGAL